MKLLHTSDWHLGRRLLGVDLLAAQRDFLDWLVELAVEQEVAAILVSGDVFDRALPAAECVDLLDDFVAEVAGRGLKLVMIPGNHDSAVRLRYGGRLFAHSGVHVMGDLCASAQPVRLTDEFGTVGIYGIPYLHPDTACLELGVDRSHQAVLAAASERIRQDARDRGLSRTVLLAHAFVTGGVASDSEREIRVGGIGDTPASVFDGFSYVALGHLHGPQEVRLAGSPTVLAYSGSPLAFSFSERDHSKSVTIVELDAGGVASRETVATPVPRPLRQVTGTLAELLERAQGDLVDLREAYVKVILTDAGRPNDPMARLRAVWPHTLLLDFAAPSAPGAPGEVVERAGRVDAVATVGAFAQYVRGGPLGGQMRAIIRDAVEAAESLDLRTAEPALEPAGELSAELAAGRSLEVPA